MIGNNKNYVEFENGEIFFVKEFNKIFPTTMLKNNTLSIEVCQFIVNKYYKLSANTLEWKILVNILALRSNKVNIITMLILVSKVKKIKIINIDFIDEKFNELFDNEVQIINKEVNHSYIDKSQFINAIIKFFINKAFRLFKNKKIEYNLTVIRTWTDLDIELHREIFCNASIFIYPFGINLRRSFNFIKKCFKENYNFTLMGVPYSFRKLMKIFLTRNKFKDLLLLEYEMDGMRRHNNDFINFKTVYTSDEYLPAVPSLYKELILQKKTIINVAHGIGTFNPYNIYNKFRLINNLQKIFYEKFEQNIEYSIYKENLSFEKYSNENFEMVFVFVHQNFSSYTLLYEESLQQKILIRLNSLNLNNIYIKLHPNCGKKEKEQIFSHYKNLLEIKTFDAKVSNYTFFTMYSTAYYDFSKFGKFIFVRDDLFNPENFFIDIDTIHFEELQNYIINKGYLIVN